MKYYVYELINSLDGKTFYVGKGRKRRMYIHENRAKRPTLQNGENPKLRNKIRSIWRKGGNLIYNQTFFTDDNSEAYTIETNRIKEIGLENLCNLRIHPLTPEECYELRSRQMIGRRISDETKNKIKNTLIGHSVRSETRHKMRLKKLGIKNPCSESKRLAISLANRPKKGFPILISPTGESYSVDVMTLFCQRHNLNGPSVSELMNGKRRIHKGWSVAPQLNG